jgi:hypothetical protein
MKKLTQKILSALTGKIGIVSLIAICLTMFHSNTQAQTLLVNYDFASAVAGSPCTATPLTTATNVTSIFTTGGTDGETCTTPLGMSPQLEAFAENQDESKSVSLNSSVNDAVNYFQFQLSGVGSYRDYKLYFQATHYGPIDVQYSIDGNNFTSFTQIPRDLRKWRNPSIIIDMSSVTAINRQPTVYFRLVGKSDINPGLTFEIDNFQMQATAAPKSRKRVRFF